jgi:hypothetical protein
VDYIKILSTEWIYYYTTTCQKIGVVAVTEQSNRFRSGKICWARESAP